MAVIKIWPKMREKKCMKKIEREKDTKNILGNKKILKVFLRYDLFHLLIMLGKWLFIVGIAVRYFYLSHVQGTTSYLLHA